MMTTTAQDHAVTAAGSHPTTLFRTIEERFSSTNLGGRRWYLVAISALVGGGRPEIAANLYQYLIQQSQYSTSESRQALVRRLREALVKCVSIVGVCRPLEAIFCIDEVERPEDKDYSFSREHWQSGDENHERGTAWLQKLYQGNIDPIFRKFDAHKDFAWITSEISYGLYLSDHTILDGIDTEMVVLAGIMIQNLRHETHWHLRGTRRLGVSMEDVEVVHQCIELVARFTGSPLNRVPHVADVEHEV